MSYIHDEKKKYEYALIIAKTDGEKIKACEAYIKALKREIKDCYSYL